MVKKQNDYIWVFISHSPLRVLDLVAFTFMHIGDYLIINHH